MLPCFDYKEPPISVFTQGLLTLAVESQQFLTLARTESWQFLTLARTESWQFSSLRIPACFDLTVLIYHHVPPQPLLTTRDRRVYYTGHFHSSRLLQQVMATPLDSKEIKPVNPKGNQPCKFIGKTDAEAPILWPPDESTHWKRP